MPSKAMHAQLLPLIVVAAGFLLLSVVSFRYYAPSHTDNVLRTSLMTHFVSIRPDRNGLAHISTSASPNARTAISSSTHNLAGAGAGAGATLGGTTQLMLSLQQATQ
jgi:hypothetical protein